MCAHTHALIYHDAPLEESILPLHRVLPRDQTPAWQAPAFSMTHFTGLKASGFDIREITEVLHEALNYVFH